MTRRTVPVRLAVVLVALLVVGACSGGGGETEAVDAADDASAETSGSASTLEDADAGGRTDGDTDGDTSTSTPAPTDGASDTSASSDDSAPTTSAADTGQAGGADPGAAEETATPARPIVPRSGTYTYRRTTTSNEGTQTENHDASVQRLSGDDHTGRVRITMESEQGTLTNDASVSDAGLLVEHSVISSPLGEIDCDWEPDWYAYGALAEGSTWTIDTSCHDTATGLEVDVAITGSGSVVGIEEIDVAGARVTTWVLETTTVTEFTVTSPTVNGTQRSESTSRTWLDPARGMQVRDESRSENSGDFQSGTSEVVSEFLSFTPG